MGRPPHPAAAHPAAGDGAQPDRPLPGEGDQLLRPLLRRLHLHRRRLSPLEPGQDGGEHEVSPPHPHLHLVGLLATGFFGTLKGRIGGGGANLCQGQLRSCKSHPLTVTHRGKIDACEEVEKL